MNGNLAWLATLATIVLLFGYEAVVINSCTLNKRCCFKQPPIRRNV